MGKKRVFSVVVRITMAAPDRETFRKDVENLCFADIRRLQGKMMSENPILVEKGIVFEEPGVTEIYT